MFVGRRVVQTKMPKLWVSTEQHEVHAPWQGVETSFRSFRCRILNFRPYFKQVQITFEDIDAALNASDGFSKDLLIGLHSLETLSSPEVKFSLPVPDSFISEPR